MKILVLTGSPKRNGTSACLADQFQKGAEEAGHEVVRFDAGWKKIHPCIACERCHTATEAQCVFEDDMKELNRSLLQADAIVFATPIYYFGMTAQIKAAIDRFYANDELLKGDKKCFLFMTHADDQESTVAGPIATYQAMLQYLEWEDAGILDAGNCPDRDSIEKTEFPQKAYQLGADFA